MDDFLKNVDAVSIATPTPTHFDLVRQCIQQHVHVLVEKPITDSTQNASELVNMIDGTGLVVQVGHIERFNPTYIELKNVLENHKVLAINFRRLSPYRVSNKDVDVVLDLMVHDLDLCVDLIGSEPVSVSAYGLAPFSNSLDYVVAQLMYLHGPLITLTASRVTEEKIRSVEVTTEGAYIEADFLNKNISGRARLSGSRRARSTPEPARSRALTSSRRDENPLSREADEWERYAAELAKAGRRREAIRGWYHAVLMALFRSGALHHQKSRTNWEYASELAPETRFRPAFLELTRLFDRERYGREASASEALARSAGEARAILKAVRNQEGAV